MLLSIYQWLNTTRMSAFLQGSSYTFPVVEVIHLMGITILLGASIIVCLRFLGWGIKQPASVIYEGLRTWTWIGFWVTVITGFVMIVAEPIKLSSNLMFGYKIYGLALGFALHLFGYLRYTKPGRAEASPIGAKIVAILLLMTWLVTGVGGRLIGFV